MAKVYANAGEAAKIAGNSSEMDRVANSLKIRAKAAAVQHRDSGKFGDSIVTRTVRGPRGVLDRLVVATDPLAAVKELGHTTPSGTRVPGQHSMLKAIASMPRSV